jgi:phage gp36-like protein
MAYAIQADLAERFGAAELVMLTDRSEPPTGAADAAVVTRALADADAEINAYLSARYPVPLATVPTVIVRIACDIARYFLYEDRVTDLVRQRYEDAVSLLKGIAAGKVSIGPDPEGGQPPVSGGASFAGQGRVFSRDTMGGF